MMKKIVLVLLVVFYAAQTSAQSNDKVLLTIEGQPVYASEFKRVFSKNLSLIENEKDRDIEEYLDLFINYKLKVKEAERLQLDTLPTFLGEYNIYKKQLARKYINQNEVSEKLIKQAYERAKNEVNASHILVGLNKNATPKDTLKAYNKIVDIRKKALAGEKSFEELAKEYSEDPSAARNGGNLGWFTVFDMVYPFENAAYATEVGQISKPIKTQYGYHIVKLNDKRKFEGEVTVAHIMIEENQGDDSPAEKQIQEVYNKLQNGASFEEMAKQFSDDKNTAVRGGKINPFRKGRLNSDKFEEQAFGLEKVGDISKPFNTKYGWHIVKLINKDEVGTFEDEKFEMERKIKKGERAQMISSDVLKKIKKLYDLQETEPGLAYFKENINVNLTRESWDAKQLNNLPQKNMIYVEDEGKTYADFAKFVTSIQKQPSEYSSTNEALEGWYEDYKNTFLNEYHRNHLAEVDEDYAHVVEEYRNGLLLFDLMEKKVWKAAKQDSTSLKEYYNNHSTEYKMPTTIEATIYSANDKKLAKNIQKSLKKGDSISIIKKEYPSVIINTGNFRKDDTALPNKLKMKEGVSKPYKNNGLFVVVDIVEVTEAKLQTFDEARGKVISDYQQELEKEWLAGLRNRYSVEVNQETFKDLKKQFD